MNGPNQELQNYLFMLTTINPLHMETIIMEYHSGNITNYPISSFPADCLLAQSFHKMER